MQKPVFLSFRLTSTLQRLHTAAKGTTYRHRNFDKETIHTTKLADSDQAMWMCRLISTFAVYLSAHAYKKFSHAKRNCIMITSPCN